MYKQKILDELVGILNYEKLQNNYFKINAYKRVIEQIKSLKSVDSYNDLKDVKGIGVKIKEKILKIINGESLKNKIYSEILDIHGIGSIKAKELLEKFKITSIDDLKQKIIKYPDLLNDSQKIGLKYFEDFKKKIPRDEMKKHLDLIRKTFPKLNIKMVGSYRRKGLFSGDIDLLILNKDEHNTENVLSEIIKKLKNINYIKDTISIGKNKFMGVSSIPPINLFRRIDILVSNKKEYPFSLLYFTGDVNFNVMMRKKARKLGYILNEHGFKPDVKNINSEKDIMNFIGMDYIKPIDRK